MSTDFLATFIPQRSASYTGGGTRTVTTANVNTPSNYTVNEANILDYDTMITSAFGFGPRFNVEYNFPYVPNLLIGVSTGIFVKFGGETTTVTTRTNQSTTYTGGVAGTPTYNSNHGETVTTVTSPGNNGGTYGIGGSGFTITGSGLIPISVTGTFRLRYAF